MKDSEFIGLLNLYLDHEITPEDSARLETEVLRNPERLRLYRQYCQMQKACVTLAEQARGRAPAEEILAATFAPRRSWSVPAWTGGLLAAAACTAFVIVSHRRPAPAAAASAAVAASAPAAPAPALAPLQKFQPVFEARALAANDAARPALFTPAARDGQFAWMERIQMAPIQSISVEKLFAEPKPSLQYDTRPAVDLPQNGPTESAAFQYAK